MLTEVTAPKSDDGPAKMKEKTIPARSSPQSDSPTPLSSPELEPEPRRMWSASALGRDLQRSSRQVSAQLQQRQQQRQQQHQRQRQSRRRPHTAHPNNSTERVTVTAVGRPARALRPESAFAGGRDMPMPRSGVTSVGGRSGGARASARMRPKSSPAARKQMVRSRLKDHWFSEHLVPQGTSGHDTKFGAEFGISVGVGGLLRGREHHQHRHHHQPSTKGALQ